MISSCNSILYNHFANGEYPYQRAKSQRESFKYFRICLESKIPLRGLEPHLCSSQKPHTRVKVSEDTLSVLSSKHVLLPSQGKIIYQSKQKYQQVKRTWVALVCMATMACV